MKNNKISKITILASLLVAGIVNAQEFYTCVPKKDWWKSTMKESIKEQKKEEWRLIYSRKFQEKDFEIDINSDSSKQTNLLNYYEGALFGKYKINLIKDGEITSQKIVEINNGKHLDFYAHSLKGKKITDRYDFTDAMFINRDYNLGFHLDGNDDYLVAGMILVDLKKVVIASISWKCDSCTVNSFEPFMDATLEIYKKVED